jgi:hypothetical protein
LEAEESTGEGFVLMGDKADKMTERNRDEFLMPEDTIGAMDPVQRAYVLGLGMLYNHARFCALSPDLDCSPALMAIIRFYADDAGSCTIEVAKLAKFLARSERAIRAAYKQLEADGVIIVRSGSPGTLTSVVRK